MTGRVEKAVEIEPIRAILTGKAGTQLEKRIRIIPKEGLPFKIVRIRAREGGFIKFHLEEEKSSGKETYLLTVENLRTEKGRYYDLIYIETDNPEIKPIRIPVIGSIH